MLDVKFVRANVEAVMESLKKRYSTLTLDSFLKDEEERRGLLIKVEELRNRRNVVSEEIGRLKKAGQDASAQMHEMKGVSADIKALDEQLNALEDRTNTFLMEIPNVLDPSVPVGRDDTENIELRKWGTPRKFEFTPLNHWDIAEKLDIIDFERASKISGARFAIMKDLGARLERAVMNFMLDHNTRNGFTEVFPPVLVTRQTMTGTGQLPKFEDDLFRTADPELFLIPTAEVPVTNIHRDEILAEGDLPIYYTAYTPCFRREAGSHGKDTRGLIRQHQFNKVEMVKFVRPEDSAAELETLTANAEEILKALGLPFRTVTLCSGDTGFSACKTYDIEVWLPGADKYREISSCSNFGDFQARRAGIRFRREGKKGTEFVHTLNGSALAMGRTVVAILENYQQQDGSVAVPEVLRPYMGVDVIKA